MEDKTARQVPRRMTTKTCGSNTIFFFSACVLYFKRCGRACFLRLFLSVCCAAFCVLHKYKCSHQRIHSRSLALSLSRLTKTSFVLAHVVLASRSRPALRVTFYYFIFPRCAAAPGPSLVVHLLSIIWSKCQTASPLVPMRRSCATYSDTVWMDLTWPASSSPSMKSCMLSS